MHTGSEHVRRAIEQGAIIARLETRAKVSLLRIHGWKALLIGALMMATGGNYVIEEALGVWTRPALATLAFVSGAFLLASVELQNGTKARSKVEALALGLVGLWDALMLTSILVSMSVYRDWQFYSPLEVMPPEQPRPFVVVVYAALTMMVWTVHLATTVEKVRNPAVRTGASRAFKELAGELARLEAEQALCADREEALRRWGHEGWRRTGAPYPPDPTESRRRNS